jgi:hypothetical protein
MRGAMRAVECRVGDDAHGGCMKQALFAVGLLLLALAAGPSSAQEDSAVGLAVRIVPTGFTETGGRAITLFDPSQHFSVVITNVGKSPVRLWRDWCSWGYFNLSFEATDQDGMRVAVTKNQRAWDKNYPDWMIIPPGDHMVIEVAFDAATWRNAPVPPPGQQRTVKLRALYEVPADAEAKTNKVWTGKASSPENTYTLFR